MKRYHILFLFFLFSCATETMITGSWKNSSTDLRNYKRIMVASMTNTTVAKANLENEIAEELKRNRIFSVKSLDLFPPSMDGSDSSHALVMKKVKANNLDAILVVTLLKKETESRYTPGTNYYDPFAFSWYGNYWGYYSYWSPYTYSPGYYTETTVFYLETNLYDAKTEKLVWSAQSKTYDLLTEPHFSHQFAQQIVDKMKADGVIKDDGKYDN